MIPDNPSILIKFPSRSRPHKMFAALDNIQSMIGIDDFVIALAVDLDDSTVNNPEVKRRLAGYDNLLVYWGRSKNKIDALNRSIPMGVNWRYLVVTADDFWFVKKGFGKQIISDFEQYFPDGDAILHYPDGYVNDKLLTLPVMGRKYYERTAYVYNPEYVSVRADREQQDVAQKLGKYKFIDVQIAEHQHYRWKGSEKDELNKVQDCPANYVKDKNTYNKRKLSNFGL